MQNPPSLAALQNDWHGYFHQDKDANSRLSACINPGILDANTRLGVYENTKVALFASTLAATYPVVAELVGQAYFKELAKRYSNTFASLSPNLLDYGGNFAEFIQNTPEASQLTYLPDMARFEWLQQQALFGPEGSPLDIATIAHYFARDGLKTRFSLRANIHLFASDYPIDDLWHWHQAEDRQEFVLNQQSIQLLIARPKLQVEIVRLDAAMVGFLRAVALGQSLDEIAAEHPEWDDNTLVGLLKVGLERAWVECIL